MKQVKSKRLRKRSRKSQIQTHVIPFTASNYFLFGLGLLLVILGYVALAQPPADSFMSLTVAPILLIIGYCIVIPIAILYRNRESGLSDSKTTNGKY